MKVLSTEGLTKLIQLIKSSFISTSNTVTTNTVTLADVATSGDFDDLTNKPTIPSAISDLTDNTSTNPIDKAKSVEDQRDSSSLKYWTGTKAQYDAIATKDSDTVYNITDDTEQYIDNKANTSLNNITSTAKSNIVSYSMPSTTYIDITVGSSGFSYTAPANGYIYVAGQSTATNGRIEVFTSMLGTKCVTPVASNSVRVFVPIVEGDIAYFYYASVSFNTCRFVYAQGEV